MSRLRNTPYYPMNPFRYAYLLCLALTMQGCATPSEKYLETAAELRLDHRIQTGSPYRHRLFFNAQAERSDAIAELHVYLDGDGTPWQGGTRIADDPTPRNPLVARMMAKDAMPSILLGRPCYYGLERSPGCDEAVWTSHRYAAEVVASMETAIRNWMSTRTIGNVVLIGYSGGGTLATLLASRIKNTRKIVTIAANLDTEAWSRRHHYAPLSASLNPLRDARIPAGVLQYHLAGLDDDNVPADIIESFSRTQPNAIYLPFAGYDHGCCWLEAWPEVLNRALD